VSRVDPSFVLMKILLVLGVDVEIHSYVLSIFNSLSDIQTYYYHLSKDCNPNSEYVSTSRHVLQKG
jgi:hypothetical protein